jgi:hypothetical protein
MAKTYNVAGTSVLKGEKKLRFAADMDRVKVLQRNGHTDVQLYTLPNAMTKEQATEWLAAQGIAVAGTAAAPAAEVAAEVAAPAAEVAAEVAAPAAAEQIDNWWNARFGVQVAAEQAEEAQAEEVADVQAAVEDMEAADEDGYDAEAAEIAEEFAAAAEE